MTSEKSVHEIFISYRWNETKEDVWKFAEYLQSLNNRFNVWLDKQEMYANKLERMEEGIKKACVVIIFFSDDYQTSIDCRTEAEAAYRHNKKKLFVKMQQKPCSRYQNWFAPIIGNNIYVDFYAYNKPAEEILKHVEKLIEQQDEANNEHRVERFGDVPSVSNYTERFDDETAIQEAVIEICDSSEIGGILVIGEGGIGKSSTVAKAVATNEKILRHCFVDVVVWLNVYQLSMAVSNSDNKAAFENRAFYADFAERLNIKHGPDDTLFRIQDHLKNLPTNNNGRRGIILIVLDDLFHEKIFQCAFRLGENVRCIGISRNRNVVGPNSDRFLKRIIEIKRFSNEDIITMFQACKTLLDDDRIARLAELCAGLPLLASVLRAKLRRCTARKQAESVVSRLFACSPAQYLVSEKWDDDDKKQETISQLLLSGFENEPEHVRYRYYAFLLFDEGAAVELADLAILWQCDVDEASEIGAEFRNMSLVRANYLGDADETYTVHAYLYAAAREFALKNDSLASNFADLREVLMKQAANDGEGENVLHLAARNRRMTLMAVLVRMMKSNQKLMFQLCGQKQTNTGETPLHYLLREDWPKNAGMAWETCHSLEIACELIDRLLLTSDNKDAAISILEKIEDFQNNESVLAILTQMASQNGAKWYTNPFMVASANDNRATSRLLLDNCGVDINIRDEEGNTGLIRAILNWRSCSVIHLLKQQGEIDVNAANSACETALTVACMQGDTENCRRLLDFPGIDVNAVDDKGNTALIYAAMNGYNEIVRWVLENNADVTVRNKRDESALCQAVYHGHIEAAKMLHDSGGRLDLGERAALVKIAKSRRRSDVETLLQEGMRNSIQPGSGCFYPLFRTMGIYAAQNIDDARISGDIYNFFSAVFHNRLAEIEQLLMKNSSALPFTPQELWMALALACFCGYEQIVKLLLLTNKANVNGKSARSRWTALMYASQNNHQTIVQMLLENGADPRLTSTHENWTALHIAARNGYADVVDLLLGTSEGISMIEARTDQQKTPLYLAAEQGNTAVLEKLLAKKADPNVKQHDGCSAITVASKQGHYDVVKLLLAANVDVDVTQKEEATPLMYASMHGYVKLVELLLAAGANVNARQKDDRTALHYAAQSGADDVAKLLIANKADVNALNKDDYTPLLVASYHGKTAVVKVLLSAKADVTVKNESGESAMAVATKNGHDDIVKMLKNVRTFSLTSN